MNLTLSHTKDGIGIARKSLQFESLEAAQAQLKKSYYKALQHEKWNGKKCVLYPFNFTVGLIDGSIIQASLDF